MPDNACKLTKAEFYGHVNTIGHMIYKSEDIENECWEDAAEDILDYLAFQGVIEVVDSEEEIIKS